jgi:hypothetical protein
VPTRPGLQAVVGAVDGQVGHDSADAKASVAAGEDRVRRSRKRSERG